MNTLKSGALPIVVGIIIVIGLAVGGAYYLGTKQAAAPVEDPNELEIVATSSASSQVKAEVKTPPLIEDKNKEPRVLTAYVKKIEGKSLVVDPFEILNGEAAVAAKIADGTCQPSSIDKCFPNGKIYYRNQDNILSTLDLDPKVVILTAFEFDKSLNGVIQISLEEFNHSYVRNPVYESLGHRITLQNGVVTKIEQIFRP